MCEGLMQYFLCFYVSMLYVIFSMFYLVCCMLYVVCGVRSGCGCCSEYESEEPKLKARAKPANGCKGLEELLCWFERHVRVERLRLRYMLDLIIRGQHGPHDFLHSFIL